MLVLAIESSTKVAGVALVSDNGVVMEQSLAGQKEHSRWLMRAVADIFTATATDFKSVDAIAVSSGPGSFTGLRIGMTVAKSLAQVWNVPVYPVPTLQALAHNVSGVFAGCVCPVIDAMRDEVYASVFDGDENITGYMNCAWSDFARLLPNNRPLMFLGEGLENFKDRILALGLDISFAPANLMMPRASSVGLCALDMLNSKSAAPELYSIAPLYIRRSEAEVRYDEKHKLDCCGGNC